MTHVRSIPDFSRPLPPREAAQRHEPISRYLTLPQEDAPGTIEPWEAVAPVRPDTPHSVALRFLNATGEALTAVLIIVGGIAAYGFIPTV
ncbi:hypothetical protein [Methylobacterium sp. SD21]|uniref:hypothetical protein n=1 Tax=Methylobacterium litchii TaxID=3138810 RepID=UPI00313E5FFD